MVGKKPHDPLTIAFDFSTKVPDGDDHERDVCNSCGWIHYVNPKIVVGSVCQWEDRILMCKRSIEPRKGFWTLPAGFLEVNESVADGAKREAREEACADISIQSVLAIYSIPHISQIQIMHVAKLNTPDIAVGPESEEVGLFRWDEIPWDDFAFPSVHWALHQFNEVRDTEVFAPFLNPEGELAEVWRKMKRDPD